MRSCSGITLPQKLCRYATNQLCYVVTPVFTIIWRAYEVRLGRWRGRGDVMFQPHSRGPAIERETRASKSITEMHVQVQIPEENQPIGSLWYSAAIGSMYVFMVPFDKLVF